MTRPPDHPQDDAWIEQMLDDLARAPVADVPDDLMARVLGDAGAVMPPPGGAIAPVPWWRQLVEALGGWGAVGGVATAAATGFVVGFGGLDVIGFEGLWALESEAYYESQDAFSAFGWDIEEG